MVYQVTPLVLQNCLLTAFHKLPFIHLQTTKSFPNLFTPNKKELEMKERQKYDFNTQHNSCFFTKVNHADAVWLSNEEITVTAQSNAGTRFYNVTTISGNTIWRKT